MRDPSALTILAEVPAASWDALRAYLKTRIDPYSGGGSRDLRFENYPNLHFLSFCMPPSMERAEGPDAMGGFLVMEATFDGPEDAFIRDLVACDLNAVVRIFGRCRDFPRMARENPHLVEIFLTQHMLPSQAFFSGAPGKSVTQIRREQTLRRRLGAILRRAPKTLLAAEPRRLQDHLRREALRDVDIRPLAEPPEPTASLTDSRGMMRLARAGLAAPVLLIGAALFCFSAIASEWRALIAPDLTGALRHLAAAAALLLALGIAGDMAKRGAERVNPRAWPFVFQGLAAGASLIVRIAMALLAIRVIFLLAAEANSKVLPDHWALSGPVLAALIIFFALAYLFALYLGVARASAGRLQRADRSDDATIRASLLFWGLFFVFWTAFALSLVPLVMVLLAMAGEAAIAAGLWLWSWGMTLGGWFAAGLAAILAIWVLLLKIHDLWQRRENKKLSEPLKMYNRTPYGRHRWADEEHGDQRRQNHYISLTNVKPGLVRYCLLIMALAIVNFLARYKDNQGTLGGIPTIFSARWALIDEGRRLLFMTNYSGAWDSYLNEFSELASVIGVNLIWTNTFIATNDPRTAPGIHFPETHLFTGRGARKTLPFKAFVRRSQLETLVWYGAYRDLSVVNVLENARIREAVFGPVDAAALDLLLKRL